MKHVIKTGVILLLLSAIILAGGKKEEVVVLETNFGEIVIKLYNKKTPKHANNFKKLVKEGFYNGLTFHRVIPGFVIQGGDPLSKDDDKNNDGTGSPGYTIPAEIGELHIKGTLGAARTGDRVNPKRASNGSQFYICLENLPNLDVGGYTVFGEVVTGWKAINAIAALKTNRRQNPETPAIIKKAYLKTMEIKKK